MSLLRAGIGAVSSAGLDAVRGSIDSREVGIAVLGPLTVDGGQHLGRRDRVVLSALVVHPGDVVSADVLADVLWGDELPASWIKIVQGCVVRLRKALGNRSIETSSRGYRLTVPSEEIDAQRFERAVELAGVLLATDAERAAAVLSGALRLWRGRPLIEVECWDAARIEAARLEELRQFAQETAVEAALRSGRHSSVLGKAQALVTEAPLRERRSILLATAQYRSGRQAEALDTVLRLRAVLNRELGVDPSPEIDELQEAILRQDPALAPAEADALMVLAEELYSVARQVDRSGSEEQRVAAAEILADARRSLRLLLAGA